MARKILTTPASSLYSERFFSETGVVLLSTKGKQLLFIHHNLYKLYKLRGKEFRRKIKDLLKPGIKISDVCLKFETNVSEHKTILNDLETMDNSFKLALSPRMLQ